MIHKWWLILSWSKRFSNPKYVELPGPLPLGPLPGPCPGPTGDGGLQRSADPLQVSSCLQHEKRPLAFYKLNLEHKNGSMTEYLEKPLKGITSINFKMKKFQIWIARHFNCIISTSTVSGKGQKIEFKELPDK